MRPWTEYEIEALRKYFMAELSLREIAMLLNRSITAINKALARFGIRQKRQLSQLPLQSHSYSPIPIHLNLLRPPVCDMQEVYQFVALCMHPHLKWNGIHWTYRGTIVDQRRAFVLINLAREERRMPAFHFHYGFEDF